MNPLRSPLLRCLQEVLLVGTCKWWAYAYIRGIYPLHSPQRSNSSTQLVINHFFCNKAVPSLESSLYLWDLFFVTESVEGTNRLINVFVFLFLNSLFHILNNTSKEAEGAAQWMTWDEGRLLREGKGEVSWKCPLECCSDLFRARREVLKLVVNDEAPKSCKIRLSFWLSTSKWM